MNTCLFCNASGPYVRLEHIIPEALGNDDLILRNEECDECNQYFGSKVESFVLAKTPLAFWRTFLGIRKKKGELPHVDLSQPRRQKGRLPVIHKRHDNGVGFTCHEDFPISVDIDDDVVIQEIRNGKRDRFTFVFTPLVLSMLGRFFCKIGVELLCLADPMRARSESFKRARLFSRYGNGSDLWPIFYGQSGSIADLKKRRMDAKGFWRKLCVISTGYWMWVLSIPFWFWQ